MEKWLYKLRRYILTIRVDMYPTHPEAVAKVVVTDIWFNKFKVTAAEYYLFAYDEQYDVSEVFELSPKLDIFLAHYPEDWDLLVEEVRERKGESSRI